MLVVGGKICVGSQLQTVSPMVAWLLILGQNIMSQREADYFTAGKQVSNRCS